MWYFPWRKSRSIILDWSSPSLPFFSSTHGLEHFLIVATALGSLHPLSHVDEEECLRRKESLPWEPMTCKYFWKNFVFSQTILVFCFRLSILLSYLHPRYHHSLLAKPRDHFVPLIISNRWYWKHTTKYWDYLYCVVF